MNARALLITCLLTSACIPAHSRGWIPKQDQVTIGAARKKVEIAEARLSSVKASERLGDATATQVIEARILLSEAKIRLAETEHSSERVTAELRNIVGLRDQLLGFVKAAERLGEASPAAVNMARIDLAEARALVEIHILIGFQEVRVALTEQRMLLGEATIEEVELARTALAEARLRWVDARRSTVK